jgi:hypothetical protein
MNAFDRRDAEILRGLDSTEFAVFDSLQHMISARWHFEAGHQLAVDQLAAAMMHMVIV